MRRISFVLLLTLALVPAAGPAPTSNRGAGGEAAGGSIRHVILVSVDGLMPAAYTEPEKHGLQIPTLRELVRGGAWSDGVPSVFPAVTYPSHTSIATGVHPGTHGIVANLAWDPLERNDEGWRWYAEDIARPTLWEAARVRGLRTALIWWPVTVGARGTVVVPEIWRKGTPDDAKLARSLATPGVLEAVEKRFPGFRAGFTPPQVSDEALADIAVHTIETVRPHLLLLHIFEVDNAQHEAGVFSERAREAIEKADRQIARLIAAAKKAGIWEHTALVVVSDHGFAPVTHRVRPGVLLEKAGLVTLDEGRRIREWKAVVVPASGSAFLYLRDAEDHSTRKTLRDVFAARAGQPGTGIGRVYTQEEIRAKGGDPAAFLAIEAAPGFRIDRGYTGDYIAPSATLATHGFDPERSDMKASLLIYGPPIAPGRISSGRLIDVAPTIAQWQGLKMDWVQGVPLPVVLRRAARSSVASPSR